MVDTAEAIAAYGRGVGVSPPENGAELGRSGEGCTDEDGASRHPSYAFTPLVYAVWDSRIAV